MKLNFKTITRQSDTVVGQPSCSPQLAARNSSPTTRQGMSLIEVLISMFVLLFGLLGVAAIFPVGNHYVTEGEKYDFSSALAQNAFEELKGRGMLRPGTWLYADSVQGGLEYVTYQGGPNKGQFVAPIPSPFNAGIGPGHAFVIDPVGAANANQVRFPFEAVNATGNNNPWIRYLHGSRWPVRRITLPTPDPANLGQTIPMSSAVAETIFRLRDDLSVNYPEADDQPSQQLWDAVDGNNTPDDMTDDTLLRRQYKGNYSWLATVVPTSSAGLVALQPSDEKYGEIDCDVSVAVFRKRDELPSTTGERLITARLALGGELILYNSNTDTAGKEIVDKAVEDFRPGSWVLVTGRNRTTHSFMMKWYRVLSLDEESKVDNLEVWPNRTADVYLRRAMIVGPDWPGDSIYDLRAAILPGVISVVTKPMKMENFSLWQQQ